jgi:hypothetical protein
VAEKTVGKQVMVAVYVLENGLPKMKVPFRSVLIVSL